MDTEGQIRQPLRPLRPEARLQSGLPAPQHAWPATYRLCMSAGVRRCRWRLLLSWLLAHLRMLGLAMRDTLDP
jgi:hypothetical protein